VTVITASRLLFTLIGVLAILMWGALALLATNASAVPPFQLVAMTMTIGALVGMATWPFRPGAARALKAPIEVWALGIYGLFGYHVFYFMALRLAPPVEANLVNYLWPLLIVLFSAFLPGERLRVHHVIGALMGFLGAALIVTRGAGLDLREDYVPGFAAAMVCAVVWSSYSVLSRRFGAVPTDSVVGFCAATAVLAALCHLALETTVWPNDHAAWLAVALLGVFPTGLAFYAWDLGVKRGDIQVLGALSYATPVLSTLLLVAFGRGEASAVLWIALVLVTLGALVAGKDLLTRRARG
jgi:drug/metabolite transporter (DMT)-like permease